MPKILFVSNAVGPDTETTTSLTWLTGNGFRTGIHLFLVADRLNDRNFPSEVKSNFPARAVFTVTSAQDSTYAGVKGAEGLSEGEMLYKQGNTDSMKLTTIFTPEENVKEIISSITKDKGSNDS